jgi:protein-L-isoaspartate(D-aspartate) O-methyltransferase
VAGAPDRAPFDRIIVTAAAVTVPPALIDQLAMGGIMVLPLGPHEENQKLVKIVRTESGIERTELIVVRFVRLLRGLAQEL